MPLKRCIKLYNEVIHTVLVTTLFTEFLAINKSKSYTKVKV